MEAIFLEKTSIIFDHYYQREAIPYVSLGAALGASNAIEMAAAIRALLFDRQRVTEIINKQKDLIAYDIYKVDGKATERVCSLIADMAESTLKDPPMGYLEP